jgi:hypothetical protein
MPKPKHRLTPTLIRGLKWHVEVKVGFQLLTKLDCRKVSARILTEFGVTVSESTLYRLFVWNKNDNLPYQHTLEILANYAGFSSWFEMTNEIYSLDKFQFMYGKIPGVQEHKSLLRHIIQSDSLSPLYDFLEQFPTELDQNKKLLIGQELYSSLKSNPNDNFNFFKNFSNLPIVRSSFYEYLADPDFTVPTYEQGLIFYLKDLKPTSSSKDLQDYVFANALLLRFYFFGGNKEKAIEIGKCLYEDLILTQEDLDSLYVFPAIRYLCYRILYNEVSTGFDDEYWDWLKEYTIKYCLDATYLEQRIVIHTVLDTLFVKPSLQKIMVNEFMEIFAALFNSFPDYFFELSLQQKLNFMNPNASTFQPIERL